VRTEFLLRALEGESIDEIVLAAMLAGDPVELDALLSEIAAETGQKINLTS
jgi:hypothetical protein